MKIWKARWLDKYLGRPVCFILTIYRKVSDIFYASSSEYQKPTSIAIIKLIEQGSTVLAYAAFKKAVKIAGKKNVYLIVFKKNRHIVDIIDVLFKENIIEIDSDSIIRLVISLFKSILKMRRHKIDTVVDFEYFMRGSAIISYLIGARRRVGLHLFKTEGPYRGDLFTHKLIYNPHIHTKQLFFNLVLAVEHSPSKGNCPMSFKQIKVPDICPKYNLKPENLQQIRQKIETITKKQITNSIIVLNPNASDFLPMRRWPKDNFINLGNRIRDEYPLACIILTGTKNEKNDVGEIAFNIKGAISLAGKTSLGELLDLYSIADVLITNDSGPAHFASLTKVKPIILFGPETPLLYGPLSENAKIFSSDLICSPCLDALNFRNTTCDKGLCLSSYSVDTVFEYVKNYLSN